jgi:hypothetical protein
MSRNGWARSPRFSIHAVRFMLLTHVVIFGAGSRAQIPGSVAEGSVSEVVTEQPFSAIKFTQVVHKGKYGNPLTFDERGHVLIARDKNGRSLMVYGRQSPDASCDPPNLGVLPICKLWGSIIFDPSAGVMWHWLDGPEADKSQYVEVDLLSDQIADAKRFTSTSSDPDLKRDSNVQDLGEQDIQGLRARGVRTITVHLDSAGVPKMTIHEVWTSAQLNLVLKVVDGDPDGDEIVSGLDHISLTPSPMLFQLPTERMLRHRKDKTNYADYDLAQLENWLVR